MLRKIMMSLCIVTVLLFFFPGQGYSSALHWDNMCTIVSPEKLQSINSLPVKIVVQLNEAANPNTFKALLNGKNITGKFQQSEEGMVATVGPEDGLRIAANKAKANTLITSVKGLHKALDIDTKVFFVKVEAMTTIGPKGGVIEVTEPESPLFGIRVEIPEGALTSPKAISIAVRDNPPLFENGDSPLGAAVEIGPSGTIFSQPISITFKYDPSQIEQKGILGPNSLNIFTFDSSGIWVPIKTEYVDANNNSVTCSIDHLSTFAVYGDKLFRYPEESQSYDDSTYYPVLFVHGVQAGLNPIGDAINTFGIALDLLKNEGVDVWALEYNSWNRIEQSAVSLSLAIDKIKKMTGKNKVNIISHSMGGLVTRAYLENGADPGPTIDPVLRSHLINISRYDNDIRRFLMLGTPNHGSDFSTLRAALLDIVELVDIFQLFSDAESFIQMEPGSQFLNTLNSAISSIPEDLQIYSVYGNVSLTIPPGDGVVSTDSAKLCQNLCNDYNLSYLEHGVLEHHHMVLTLLWPIGIAKITSEDHLVYPLMRDFAKDPIVVTSSYTYTTLIPPGWVEAYALGINNTGQVVGWGSDASGQERGFLYSGGTYTTLIPPGWKSAYASKINNNGHVVGSGRDGNSQLRGFLYSDGNYTVLMPSGWMNAETWNINDSDQVVGSGRDGESVQERGFLYSGGTYTILIPLGWTEAHALGINNTGQVVGWGLDASGEQRGFIFSGGTNYTTLLPPGWRLAYASRINNTGQVVGLGFDASEQAFGFLYSGGTYTTLIPPGSKRAFANGINDAGQVVGLGFDASEQAFGFLYSGGAYTTLIPPGSMQVDTAGINNTGQVVGNYVSEEKGFIATPQ